MRHLLAATLLLAAAGQAPAPRPTFEAASVKVNTKGEGLTRIATFPTRLSAVNASLHMLVRYAFNVPDYRLSGGPGWMDADRFDIEGAAGGSAGFEDIRAMTRTVLEDRFKLQSHVEQREQAIFVLSVARRDGKLGDQMSPAGEECKQVTVPAGLPPPPPPPPGGAAQGAPRCPSMLGLGAISGRKLPMPVLVSTLAGYLNRQIVDRTNLEGLFDLDLRWTPDQVSLGPPGAP